jgi:hypothetical protein
MAQAHAYRCRGLHSEPPRLFRQVRSGCLVAQLDWRQDRRAAPAPAGEQRSVSESRQRPCQTGGGRHCRVEPADNRVGHRPHQGRPVCRIGARPRSRCGFQSRRHRGATASRAKPGAGSERRSGGRNPTAVRKQLDGIGSAGDEPTSSGFRERTVDQSRNRHSRPRGQWTAPGVASRGAPASRHCAAATAAAGPGNNHAPRGCCVGRDCNRFRAKVGRAERSGVGRGQDSCRRPR